VAGEDIGKQFRHTFVAVRDKDRLQRRVVEGDGGRRTADAIRDESILVSPAYRTCISRSKNSGGRLPVSLFLRAARAQRRGTLPESARNIHG
jgi:hypothetical protein